MATHAGNEGVVKVGSNTVAEVRSFTITTNADTAEDTVMGDTWKTHIATQKGWTAEVTAFWDETDTNGQGALIAGNTVTLNLYPEGASSTDTYLGGSAIVTAVGQSQTHNGVVEATFSFQGTGALSTSTVDA